MFEGAQKAMGTTMTTQERWRKFVPLGTALGALLICGVLAGAQDAAAPAAEAEKWAPDTGDTAWMLASSALVLLMTPGLAFFYGGLVRGKNVLNTLLMSMGAMAAMGVLWVICGYSLAFGGGGEGINNYVG